jgi:Leucine-rich repeat (LRR) protein
VKISTEVSKVFFACFSWQDFFWWPLKWLHRARQTMGNNLSQKARDQIRAAQKEGSTELILRDCQLKGVPSSLAKKLKHLKTLILSRNYIPALPPKVVHFTELETLNLDDNQLAGFPVQILDLPKLKNLSIARNNILQLPDDFGSKLNQLEKLDITGNHIAALSPDFHKLGATLIEFSFGAAGLTQVPSAVFQLVRLKSLDLSGTFFFLHPAPLLCLFPNSTR